MKTKIYTLLDKDGVIHYVGKTVQRLEHRLSVHICHARMGHESPNHRMNWIRKCLSEGYVPTIRLLEEVEGDGCQEEISYIKFFRDSGLDLVNGTDGGDGSLGNKNALGHHHSDESRAKISIARKGRKASAEARAAMSLGHMGNKSNLGRSLPTETRAKMSAAHKGKKH